MDRKIIAKQSKQLVSLISASVREAAAFPIAKTGREGRRPRRPVHDEETMTSRAGGEPENGWNGSVECEIVFMHRSIIVARGSRRVFFT